ncbi:MAG TPA: methylated-DNA--[protein]-cysteine S-methyltransferase [Actinomycetota bacterium]|nr:methylated-DNA--[protein]-cysteine S-methyltransferase [Actinomycetota bacterium]
MTNETNTASLERALRRAAAGSPAIEEGSARAAARLTESAWRLGLADVAYWWADTPLGRLLVAVSPRGLVRVSFPEEDHGRTVDELARAVSPRVVESAPATDEVRRELDEYFEGARRSFDLKVDLSPVRGFSRRVLQAAARIPFGSVRTYREVATTAGSPGATRAAGNALGANPVPIVVPCHRVVRTGGGLGGYAGGLDRKERLLRLEGALSSNG